MKEASHPVELPVMLSKWSRVVLAVSALALFAGISGINRRWAEIYAGEPPVSYLLPKPELFRYISLGYDKAVASAMFTHLVGAISWGVQPEAYTQWVYNTVRIINLLDPQFYTPYVVGGYFLRAQEGNGPDLALQLFASASTVTDLFEPFLMTAMIYYFEKRDLENAAKWFELGSKKPNAPDYAGRIAAGIRYKSDPRAAMELILDAYCSTPMPFWKERYAYEFLAYFEKSDMSPQERTALIQEFINRLMAPTCALPGDTPSMDWLTPELRQEIRRVMGQ
ncbi:MAG: hypothetical protein KIT79_02695 [Deltaproteobacteria bacterium]|nr:hypothetical protein [Deltaproteobacteria bacterium]